MKKRQSTFVAAQAPGWFEWLFGWLRKPRVYRPPTDPVLEICTEVPGYIYTFRSQTDCARILLRRYIEGRPTTRRAWTASGYTDPSWRLARRILKNAGVLSRDAKLLYTGRDATHRLNVYLDRIEQKCWQCRRYVHP